MKYPLRGIPYKVDSDISSFIEHKICVKLQKVLLDNHEDEAIDKIPIENVVEMDQVNLGGGKVKF